MLFESQQLFLTLLDAIRELRVAAFYRQYQKLRGNMLILEQYRRQPYYATRSEILDIDSQIAFTDRLIDQIVYTLCGLTKDEIKIVGSASVKTLARSGSAK